MSEPTVDEELTLLYRAPLEGFIAERDARVQALREAGRADDAAALKAARKPSVSAWALDQLAAAEPQQIQTLLDAGAELRAAQQAALSSGRNADRLRAAMAGRRQIVAALAARAAEILEGTGRSPAPHLDDINGTLEAASVDPEAASLLRSGTLVKGMREPVGFGDASGLRSVAGDAEDEGLDPDVDTVSPAELSRLRRERDAAAKRLAKSREIAEGFKRDAATAEAKLAVLRTKVASAEGAALKAELDVKRAETALDQAGAGG